MNPTIEQAGLGRALRSLNDALNGLHAAALHSQPDVREEITLATASANDARGRVNVALNRIDQLPRTTFHAPGSRPQRQRD